MTAPCMKPYLSSSAPVLHLLHRSYIFRQGLTSEPFISPNDISMLVIGSPMMRFGRELRKRLQADGWSHASTPDILASNLHGACMS
jgi:hypothetical protein